MEEEKEIIPQSQQPEAGNTPPARKKKSIPRRIFRVVCCIILGFIALNVLLYGLLSIPAVQQKVADFAVGQLKKKLNTEISLNEIRLSLFNEVTLKGLYIEDQQKDTLVYAGQLGARLDLWQLISNNELLITGIDLNDAAINVSAKTPDSPFNFQFVIDAFAGDSTETDTTTSSLKINIQDISLKNIRLRYDILSEPDSGSMFNPSHIHISDLNAALSLPSIDMRNFRGEIKNLSLREKSGLEVKKLKAYILSEGDEFYTDNLQLVLADSKLTLDVARYNMETGEFKLQTNSFSVSPKDLTPFVPGIDALDQQLKLKTSISGKLPQISADSLLLTYGNHTVINISGGISDISHYDTADMRLMINKLLITPADMTAFARIGDPAFALPDIIHELGDIRLTGELSGRLDQLKVDAEAVTRLGALRLMAKASTDTTFQNFVADATLQTQNFNLRPIVGDSMGVGRLTADMVIHASQTPKQSLALDAKGMIDALEYNDEVFSHIPFTANYSASRIGAWIDAHTQVGAVKGQMEMLPGKTSKYVFDLIVKDLNVNTFYKNPVWNEPVLSFTLKGDLQGTDINTLEGDIVLDSLSLADQGFRFEPGTITLKAGPNDAGRYIAFRSSICDLNLNGTYDFTTLYDEISDNMHPFLPDFFELSKTKKKKVNNFRIDAFIDNTEELAKVIDMPLVLREALQISGEVNAIDNKVRIEASAPGFVYGGMEMESTSLSFRSDSVFVLKASTDLKQENDTYKIGATIGARNDTLHSFISLKNTDAELPIDGLLKVYASFDRDEKRNLISTLNIRPADFQVGNLTFEILPAVIRNEGERTFIRNFGLALNNQRYIGVDGVVSDQKSDSLHIYFDKAKIGSVLEAFNVNNIKATVDGDVVLYGVLGNTELYTKDFEVKDIIAFNDTIGTMRMESRWDSRADAVKLDVALANESKGTKSVVTGLVYPEADSLRLNVNLDRLSLNWIQPFVSDMLNRLTGSLSAGLSMSGKMSAPQVDGWFGLNDAAFGVQYTNVTYHVSDTIRVSPDKIGFDYLIISDDLGNQGLASATVTHHNFENMNYNLHLQLYNLMVLNTESRTDSLFYGKVFANGTVDIDGNDKGIDVTMNVRNSKGSNLNVTIPQTTASDYQTVVYINTPDEGTKKEVVEDPLPLNLKVALNIDPQISFSVVDPISDYEMQIVGTGRIDFKYDLQSDLMTTFGEYLVNKGMVKVRLQQLKTFEFQIQENSKLIFSGDPMKTSFDIVAYRRVKADLKTLDASFSTDQNTKMNVDCKLSIKGNLNKMELAYDVVLPDAPDDTQKRVQSIISTDEQKIRQFAYLVAFGTFYSTESGGGNIGDGLLTSLASSTLSGGLNAIFGNVLGDKWQIGTDISSSDASFSDVDMSVSVSTKLFNDKLKLNTNLGYRTSHTNTNQNSFIGDFDVEYELTRNWKLKAYNHQNEQYYRQASTTQGLGIVYTKEARTLRNIFRFFQKRRQRRSSQTTAPPANAEKK
ncbi:hypothetical protein M2132_002175 [Dysgonomonas sp. PH5-45]|uniref:translocation/assembly module TamB domain-containing protein n=1 Tax=unclassified Dysgonomonas TaxID=2630389 RepID=UPI00247306B4|nr:MULTISPECIES: translocation/assembly module TamB domain-containing protein [unclassified Dysgonomonas]MDH6355828.1 hypothetical protein [Dysgonomonas sp. PH5-45]MDH6388705.1 hypothetical protein [Dysgonomonas sp. PH5-37]